MKPLFAALCALFVLAMSTSTQAAEPEGQYRHVVLFSFKSTATPEQVKGVEKAFGELATKVNTITGFEWGMNVSPENKGQGFTHCFLVTFKDKAGLETYLPHPAHDAFKALAGPFIDKVLVFDFVGMK